MVRWNGPGLHASTPAHLSIELAVLKGLIERSKFQHRSQPFLQRMREVHRLAKRIEPCLPQTGNDVESLKRFLPKFVQALLKAAMSTQQIIELEHFLPMHVSVLAVYGRLFVLASHLGQFLSLDVEELLSGRAMPKAVAKAEQEAVSLFAEQSIGEMSASAGATDLGEKIHRPISRAIATPPAPPAPPLKRKETPARSSSPAQCEDSPDPDFPDSPLAPSTVHDPAPRRLKASQSDKPKKKRAKAISNNDDSPAVKKKVKRRDAIDDIFGF